jgi:hypothetical protein
MSVLSVIQNTILLAAAVGLTIWLHSAWWMLLLLLWLVPDFSK